MYTGSAMAAGAMRVMRRGMLGCVIALFLGFGVGIASRDICMEAWYSFSTPTITPGTAERQKLVAFFRQYQDRRSDDLFFDGVRRELMDALTGQSEWYQMRLLLELSRSNRPQDVCFLMNLASQDERGWFRALVRRYAFEMAGRRQCCRPPTCTNVGPRE